MNTDRISSTMMMLTLLAMAVAMIHLEPWFAVYLAALVGWCLKARRPVAPAKTSVLGSLLATAALVKLLELWRAIEGTDDGTYLLLFAIAAMAANALCRIRERLIVPAQ